MFTRRAGALVVVAAFSGAFALPAQAQAAEADTFTGTCQLQGTASVSDPNTGPLLEGERLRSEAEGVCTGVLNDALIVASPVKLTARAVGNEIMYTGTGGMNFINERAQIDFCAQQFGLAAVLFEGFGADRQSRCRPEDGVAEGVVAPFVGESNENENSGSHKTPFQLNLVAEALTG